MCFNCNCLCCPSPHLAEMNSLLITLMVTVGLYQALCNLYRVFFSFDHRTLSPKVRTLTSGSIPRGAQEADNV